MENKVDMGENVLCLIAGIFLAICFIAIMCGDGNKGFFDLF